LLPLAGIGWLAYLDSSLARVRSVVPYLLPLRATPRILTKAQPLQEVDFDQHRGK
jgi:hypothetical protein